MTKRLLIDAAHTEEVRVVVADDERIHDLDVETAGKAQLKGNIYVAEVSRVEPSLQAAFITYGGNRNGFLAFGEVHPAYFDLPTEEKNGLLAELEAQASKRRKQNDASDTDSDEDTENKGNSLTPEEMDEDARALALVNQLEVPSAEAAEENKPKVRKARNRGGNAVEAEPAKEERQAPIHRRYQIDQVLKSGQKILVQVVKEERGTKGAALTTFFTLPGRYTVLMPNTPMAGGISRKIYDHEERKALKEAYDSLEVPDSMGLIVRTAGVGQDKEHIQRDFENLHTLWKNINKDFSKKDDAIRCAHEDGSVVMRTLRDIAHEDIDEIVISGKRVYKQAKDYIKSLMPEAAKKVKEYKDDTPLFIEYGVEQHLAKLHHSRVTLPSGGYLVIDPTEALVSVDVNSGRSTGERNIEETAYKTNMEAVEELARQIRLRDLAGLIVVDFIDMEDRRNVRNIERAMRKVVRKDRARIQVGNISDFGLMEISRQRLRPSIGESHFVMCPTCNGSGLVQAPASAALAVLRRLEEADVQEVDRVIVSTSPELVIYILNHKRDLIREMEAKYKYHILFKGDPSYMAPDHKLELVRVKSDGTETSQTIEEVLREQPEEPPEVRYSKKGKRGGRKASGNRKPRNAKSKDTNTEETPSTKEEAAKDNKETKRPRRTSKAKKPDNQASSDKTEQAVEENKPADKPKRGRKKEADSKGSVEEKPAPVIVDAPVMVEKITVEDSNMSETSQTSDKKGSFPRWWSKA